MTLRRLGGAPAAPGTGAILAVAVMRDEADILPAWLDHHRGLGVDRFHVIDHGSRDGTADLLAAQPDVVVWRAEGSYAAANCGLDWSNAVAEAEGANRWVLTLDADEFLLGVPSLPALAAALRREGALGLYAAMVDFYPSRLDTSGPSAPWPSLAALLDACPLFAPFDPAAAEAHAGFPYLTLRHAARLRLAGGGRAPRAQKLPFVFWRPGFRYARSTHVSTSLPLADTPALLAHFKHRPGLAARMVRDAAAGERLNESAHAVSAALLRRGAVGPADGLLVHDAAAALLRGGWTGETGFGSVWRQANRSREAVFDLLAAQPPVQEAAAAALVRARGHVSWRWSRGLRRWLAGHDLLSPDHLPEVTGDRRDPLTALVALYESLWWDLAAPLRLPLRLARAIRWRALWRRLTRGDAN